jgi:Icc-related predicted phosphoesterase
MRLTSRPPTIIHQIPYLNAAPRNGPPIIGMLDIVVMEAVGLGRLSALVLTGDLQFRERTGLHEQRTARLLGEVAAEELSVLCELGELPPAEATGVVLTGDLFCEESLDRRGGLGDVRGVWEKFAQHFAFVTGVAGNHDNFGELDEHKGFADSHILDLDVIALAGLTIGGVSGVIGDPKRPFRRLEDEYFAAVSLLMREPLDLLVLHESPGFPERALPGNRQLRAALEAGRPTFIACGHNHWHEPIAEMDSGSLVLNVDARCVVLVDRSKSGAVEVGHDQLRSDRLSSRRGISGRHR